MAQKVMVEGYQCSICRTVYLIGVIGQVQAEKLANDCERKHQDDDSFDLEARFRPTKEKSSAPGIGRDDVY